MVPVYRAVIDEMPKGESPCAEPASEPPVLVAPEPPVPKFASTAPPTAASAFSPPQLKNTKRMRIEPLSALEPLAEVASDDLMVTVVASATVGAIVALAMAFTFSKIVIND